MVGVLIQEDALESLLFSLLPLCDNNLTSCALVDDAAYVIASNHNETKVGCARTHERDVTSCFVGVDDRQVTRMRTSTQRRRRCFLRTACLCGASTSTIKQCATLKRTRVASPHDSFLHSSSRCCPCDGGARSSSGSTPTLISFSCSAAFTLHCTPTSVSKRSRCSALCT